MKRYALTVTVFFAFFFMVGTVHAAEGFYASLNAGVAIADDSDVDFDNGLKTEFEMKEGVAVSYAMGGNLTEFFRGELELGYQKNDFDNVNVPGLGKADISGDVAIYSLLLNGYADFKNTTILTPFVTVGFGAAQVDVSDISLPGYGTVLRADDDIVFAYQVGAGVGIEVHPRATIDLKYRYFGTSDPEFDIADAEVASHNLYVGFRVYF